MFIWTIDHPTGLVLVDTGMIDSRPEVEDLGPTPHPENIPRDVACVINTHLHFDHCGGNRLFPGVPIHVQARELADARSLDNYTFREWVDFDGATYVEHEGEAEPLPGIRLLPTPGHSDGHQVVVVETGEGTGRPRWRCGRLVRRARNWRHRGAASRARARSADVAHPRGGHEDPLSGLRTGRPILRSATARPAPPWPPTRSPGPPIRGRRAPPRRSAAEPTRRYRRSRGSAPPGRVRLPRR